MHIQIRSVKRGVQAYFHVSLMMSYKISSHRRM
jgi:hypothetical protein